MMFFPRMPLDARQATAGWTFATVKENPLSRCRLLGMDKKNPRFVAVLIEMGSGTDSASSCEVALLDTALGLMRHKEGEYYMPQWKDAGTAVGDLDSVTVLSPCQLADVKRDADAYFQALSKSWQLLYMADCRSARNDSVDIEVESLFVRTGRLLNEPLLLEALGNELTALRDHLNHPMNDR